MNITAHTEAEKMRVKQILHRGKQDIEKIFMRMEQELCASSESPPIFKRIEEYFARPFSSMELQTIQEWMHKYHPDLIEVALNEASIRNVRNIRYIDKVLLNWENAGVTDPQAAIQMSEKFRQKPTPQINVAAAVTPEIDSSPKVPFYNWLEERE